jgi:predicted phosphodiesterase
LETRTLGGSGSGVLFQEAMRRATRGRRSRRVLQVLTLCLLLPSCIEFSPFETDLDESERDQNSKNALRLQSLPAPESGFRFAVVTDNHQYVDQLAEIVDSLNARDDLAFVLHLGDLSDLGLREEYRASLGALQRLDVPFFVAVGNHDSISNGKKLFKGMFGPYDYVVNYGTTRLVLFNSNVLEYGPVPDFDWLAENTAPVPGTRVFAATHQPSRDPDYAEVLKRNGVQALFTGHRHRFKVAYDGDLLSVASDDALSGHWSLIAVDDAGEIAAHDCEFEVCVESVP